MQRKSQIEHKPHKRFCGRYKISRPSEEVDFMDNVKSEANIQDVSSVPYQYSDKNILKIGENLIITKISSSPVENLRVERDNVVSFQKIYFGCGIIKKHSNACNCLTPRLHVYILSRHQCNSSCKAQNLSEKCPDEGRSTLRSETTGLPYEMNDQELNLTKGRDSGGGKENQVERKLCELSTNSNQTSTEKNLMLAKTSTSDKAERGAVLGEEGDEEDVAQESFLGVKRLLKRRKLKIKKSVFNCKFYRNLKDRENNNNNKGLNPKSSNCLENSLLPNCSSIRERLRRNNPISFKSNGINNTNYDQIRRIVKNNLNSICDNNSSSNDININGIIKNNEYDSKDQNDPIFKKKGKPMFQINKTGTFHSFNSNFLKISSVYSSLQNESLAVEEENRIEIKQEFEEPYKNQTSDQLFLEEEIPFAEVLENEHNTLAEVKIEPIKVKLEIDDEDLGLQDENKDEAEDISVKIEDSFSHPDIPDKNELLFDIENFPMIDKEEIRCNLCLIQFPDIPSLMIHLQNHQKDGLMICYYCQKCFGDRTTLRRHIRTHTGEKPYQCKICKKRFSLPGNFKKHRDIHEDIRTVPCDICGKMFRRKEHLKQHKLTHTGEKPYKCSLCNSCFTARYSLKIHMNIHLGKKPFKCNYCGKGFSDKSTMTKHIRIHTGERPFSCNICHKRFGESGALASHVTTHSEERPFSCMQCVLSFKSNRGLRQHLKTHYGDKRYSCRYCGTMFIQKYNMMMHERIHTGEKPYQCSECNRMFRSRSCLGKHIVLHGGEEDKKYSCEFCQKKFHRKAHLKRHISTHLGLKDYECDICFKKFSRKTSLNKHVDTFHSEGARSFPCLHCGKIFKRRVYVESHKCLSTGTIKIDSES